MNMKPVKSSQISAIGHDPVTKTLAVQFTNGGVYHYHDVPADAHAALMSAESIGKHFGAHIRGKFEHAAQEAKANG